LPVHRTVTGVVAPGGTTALSAPLVPSAAAKPPIVHEQLLAPRVSVSGAEPALRTSNTWLPEPPAGMLPKACAVASTSARGAVASVAPGRKPPTCQGRSAACSVAEAAPMPPPATAAKAATSHAFGARHAMPSPARPHRGRTAAAPP
jgi:hypothetical protein